MSSYEDKIQGIRKLLFEDSPEILYEELEEKLLDQVITDIEELEIHEVVPYAAGLIGLWEEENPDITSVGKIAEAMASPRGNRDMNLVGRLRNISRSDTEYALQIMGPLWEHIDDSIDYKGRDKWKILKNIFIQREQEFKRQLKIARHLGQPDKPREILDSLAEFSAGPFQEIWSSRSEGEFTYNFTENFETYIIHFLENSLVDYIHTYIDQFGRPDITLMVAEFAQDHGIEVTSVRDFYEEIRDGKRDVLRDGALGYLIENLTELETYVEEQGIQEIPEPLQGYKEVRDEAQSYHESLTS